MHENPVWGTEALTVRAVAARAGVSERTVYRHLNDERQLRDLVYRRLEEESGIELEDLDLDRFQGSARAVYDFLSSFPLEPRTTRDPTLMSAHERLRSGLLAAVARSAGRWPDQQQRVTAALLDVLWSAASYERMVADWGLDPEDAAAGAVWVIGLVQAAIGDDRPPKVRGAPCR